MIELFGVPSMRWRRTAIYTMFIIYFMHNVHFVNSWIGYRSGDFCCRNPSFLVSADADTSRQITGTGRIFKDEYYRIFFPWICLFAVCVRSVQNIVRSEYYMKSYLTGTI